MTDLKDRQKALESLFFHNYDVEFAVKSRGNRYFGIWAAKKLGISDEQKIQDYATNLVIHEFDKDNPNQAYDKVKADFESTGITINPYELKDQLMSCYEKARAEIMGK